MLNPVHLRTLQEVVVTGSFKEAGAELGYTGSAVSQQIAALERHLGTTLFERHAHRITPNATAVYIAEQATEALGRLRELENDIESHIRGEVGALRLGAFQSVSERLLPAALQAFRQRHPRVEMPLIEDTPSGLIGFIRRHELDLAVLYRYAGTRSGWPREYETEPLFTEDHFILAPSGHPLAASARAVTLRDLHDLSSETWISTGVASTGTAMLRKLCGKAGFDPTITYQSFNYATIQGLVAADIGIALVPALGYTPLPGIVAVRLDIEDAVREVHLMRAPALREAPWQSMRTALHRAAEQLSMHAAGIHLPRT